mgnify:CR=1 FL=1
MTIENIKYFPTFYGARDFVHDHVHGFPHSRVVNDSSENGERYYIDLNPALNIPLNKKTATLMEQK